MNLAGSILKAVDSALELWKTHLERRKELYEISLDKKRQKALNLAEEVFNQIEGLFFYLLNDIVLTNDEIKELQSIKKDIDKIHKKFNKYD
jgi:hypothetical protein